MNRPAPAPQSIFSKNHPQLIYLLASGINITRGGEEMDGKFSGRDFSRLVGGCLLSLLIALAGSVKNHIYCERLICAALMIDADNNHPDGLPAVTGREQGSQRF